MIIFLTSCKNELHWLPIKQRIEFKTCVLINKCLHSAAPLYLIDMCRHVSTEPGRPHLRSAVHGDLIVPRTVEHVLLLMVHVVLWLLALHLGITYPSLFVIRLFQLT